LSGSVLLELIDSASTSFDVSDTETFNVAPGATVRFVILDPTDGTVADPTATGSVDTGVTVQVEARDQYDNVATGESRSVSIQLSYPATPVGMASISFTSGVGMKMIETSLPGEVTISLIDSANTGADTSSTQDVQFVAGLSMLWLFLLAIFCFCFCSLHPFLSSNC
jgi:hypothetical protein